MNKMIVEGKTYSMEDAVRAGYMKPSRHVDEKQESLKTRRDTAEHARAEDSENN